MSMNTGIVHPLYAALAPWLALALILLGRNPYLSRTRITGSLMLAFFLLRIPIEGWSLFAWVRVLEPNPSLTLTGLLALALLQRISGKEIFQSADWSAAWLFGALAALVLYPMGLGMTCIDPYTWGWGPVLPAATALCATILLLRGNRFGSLLLLPGVGFLLHLQESTNFWDALIDPFYGGLSLIAVATLLLRRRSLKEPLEPLETPGS